MKQYNFIKFLGGSVEGRKSPGGDGDDDDDNPPPTGVPPLR